MKMVYSCPDCGMNTGEYHRISCDIERCPKCGYQLLTCDCNLEDTNDIHRLYDTKSGQHYNRKPVGKNLDEDFGF